MENKVFVAVAIDFVPLSGRDSTICLRVTPINIILGNLLLHRLVPYLGNRRRLKRGKIEDRHKIQKTRRNAAKLGVSRKDQNLGRRIFSSLSNLGAKVTSLGDVVPS